MLKGGKICVRFFRWPKVHRVRKFAPIDNLQGVTAYNISQIFRLGCRSDGSLDIIYGGNDNREYTASSAKHGDTYKVTHYRIILIVFVSLSRANKQPTHFIDGKAMRFSLAVNFCHFLVNPTCYQRKTQKIHKSAHSAKQFTSFCAMQWRHCWLAGMMH